MVASEFPTVPSVELTRPGHSGQTPNVYSRDGASTFAMDDYLNRFEHSYRRALGDQSYNPDFIGRFYEIFLGQSQTIRDMFRDTTMSAQKTMLHDSLNQLVDFYTSRRTSEYMRHIARVHSRIGHDVHEDLYEVWLESLMHAVAEYDEQFDDEVELAWRLVLSPGITYMKFMRERIEPEAED